MQQDSLTRNIHNNTSKFNSNIYFLSDLVENTTSRDDNDGAAGFLFDYHCGSFMCDAIMLIKCVEWVVKYYFTFFIIHERLKNDSRANYAKQ